MANVPKKCTHFSNVFEYVVVSYFNYISNLSFHIFVRHLTFLCNHFFLPNSNLSVAKVSNNAGRYLCRLWIDSIYDFSFETRVETFRSLILFVSSNFGFSKPWVARFHKVSCSLFLCSSSCSGSCRDSKLVFVCHLCKYFPSTSVANAVTCAILRAPSY